MTCDERLRLPIKAGPGEVPNTIVFALRLSTPRFVMPIYFDTLLLPGLPPGLGLLNACHVEGELMATSVSEWRRLPVDLGMSGGGRMGLSDFERVAA